MPSPQSTLIACLVFLLFASEAVGQERVVMTNGRMEDLLIEEFGGARVEGQGGMWRIVIAEDDQAQADEESDEAEIDGPAEEPSEPKDEDSPDLEAADDEPAVEELPGSSAEEKLPPIMVVMTDSDANRMRLMMPIRSFDPRKTTDLRLALIALHSNYDRALDARYAVKDGVLWSVFIHPLESLTAGDLRNGIDQVRTLRRNTGTTFTSSDLKFGVTASEADDEADEE